MQVSGGGMRTSKLRRKSTAAQFKEMVTCDRYCESWNLSMSCGYTLFYCDEPGFALTAGRLADAMPLRSVSGLP